MWFLIRFWLLGLGVAVLLTGCGEDAMAPAPPTFEAPGTVKAVTGVNTIRLDWSPSAYESASDFAGYNLYIDTASMAGNDDPVFLAVRRVNLSPLRAVTATVSSTAGGGSLQQGTKYYLQVRTARSDGSVSAATGEVDTSPRPEGDNGSDASQFMYDYDALTSTKSAYGWNVVTGQGVAYATVASSDSLIDIVMVEEANSSDNGSLLQSPSIAIFTAPWARRNRTLFKDLGVGTAAWETLVAPDPATMTESIKLLPDHTYALLTHDQHWVKVRSTELVQNVTVLRTGGGTVLLNYVRFSFAVQLVSDYGRFKPMP